MGPPGTTCQTGAKRPTQAPPVGVIRGSNRVPEDNRGRGARSPHPTPGAFRSGRRSDELPEGLRAPISRLLKLDPEDRPRSIDGLFAASGERPRRGVSFLRIGVGVVAGLAFGVSLAGIMIHQIDARRALQAEPTPSVAAPPPAAEAPPAPAPSPPTRGSASEAVKVGLPAAADRFQEV